MKIVCDACQAKYSISDDKVQGKVFKIRCKKCSNIIVVRGGAGATEAPAAQEKDTRVYDYGADAGDASQGGDESVWHVVINQDQVGPMTAAEVQQRFSAGEIDAETYAWREGFADWLPLAQVDAFAGFAAGAATAAVAPSHGGGAAAVSAMFGGGGGDEAGTVRSDPGDLFASASAGAASHGDDDGGDLFGSKPSGGSSSRAQEAANAKLRGERNENSVLFSLNNLAQLASDKPAPSASVQSMPSGHATGAAGGEGSGLIDIRSMANAYLGAPGGAAKPASAGIGSIDDLPVFGGGGFSEPAVIVPMQARSNNNKMMYALIASVGLLAVAAVIVVVILLKGGKNDDKNPQVATNAGATTGSDKKDPEVKDDKPSEPVKAADTTGTKSADSTGSPPADPTKPADTAAKAADTTEKPADTTEKPADTTKPKDRPAISKTSHPASTPKTTTPKETTVAAKTPKETTPKDTGGGGCDEVSCVLNNYEGACCAKFKKGKAGGGGGTATAKSGGGGDLPDSLDRAMISDGVGKVKARVMACGDKSSAKGQVKVSVKVGGDGHVSSVSVKSTPDAALGSCVAGAMQRATFAKTASGGSFSYPFVF